MAGNHRSGRRRKPDVLRVLEGGGGRYAALPFTLQKPEPPEELRSDALALTYWHKLADFLHKQELMANEYADALVTLACVCADYRRTREQFEKIKFQAFHTERHGQRIVVVEAPILRRLNELALLRTRLLGEFGMTPVMATKVFGGTRGTYKAKKWDALSRPREA